MVHTSCITSENKSTWGGGGGLFNILGIEVITGDGTYLEIGHRWVVKSHAAVKRVYELNKLFLYQSLGKYIFRTNKIKNNAGLKKKLAL